MPNEFTIRSSLAVRKVASDGTVQANYRSGGVGSFRDDMVTTSPKGPTPGAVGITTVGTDIDLSQLTVPGWCFLKNMDDSDTVEYGIHDGSVFHPMGELGPGDETVFKFSRNFGEEHVYQGTGTGATVNTFHAKSYNGAAVLLVECWER